MATGWLHWSPDVAWNALVIEILVAMDAHVDWAKLSNPFGSPEPEKPKETKAGLASRLMATLRAAGSRKHGGQ